MEFRKALLSELPSVYALYHEVITTGAKQGTTSWNEKYPTLSIIREDVEANRLFTLREEDRLVAAVVLMETDDLDEEPLGWAPVKSCVPVRLCVAPGFQGLGFGEITLGALFSHCRAAGYESARLLAGASNAPANRLYERLGFTPKGKVRLYGSEYNAYELIL
jgi:ribosomal protein S18 acetylase RimI-like enzyme